MNPEDLPPVTLPRPRPPADYAQPDRHPQALSQTGCAWCGDLEDRHGRQWSPVYGWHSWEAEQYTPRAGAGPWPPLPKRTPAPGPSALPGARTDHVIATAAARYDDVAALRDAVQEKAGRTTVRALILRLRRAARTP